ncbi:aspartate kinase [Virgibacillus phasianinus]|uniref:Aspartokinase n=1 Tax=Virgibacillus phasianinus TaxID=2017483 RepID=A0A220U6X3_9BACI|nr:aspartate kinase [Virgibacillus phasianinus]ASK64054.1 aspartate kinase [Virgibacillus phasianinus]
MTILVQKFGGTSLQSPMSISKVITHIKNAIERKYKVVVVVSALGRKPDPYATDTLLSLVNNYGACNEKREMDLLMSCGETIASVKLSNELQHNDLTSIALTGAQAGIMTSSEFTQANIKHINTARLLHELTNYDVVVVAGFQGQTSAGDITTIGRGGSDTTAAALGVALNAEKVEIFTDVNGIMTADPRMVKSARKLPIASYSETSSLAYQGAKVIHPKAVEIAMQANIPLHVRSTFSKKSGTLVTNSTIKRITSIAYMPALTQINVKCREKLHPLHSAFLQDMTEAGMPVDFVKISRTDLFFTIPSTYTQSAVNQLTKLGFLPQVKENCAKVSVVGGIIGVTGIALKVVQTLIEKGIEILQSADGHITTCVLIHEKDVSEAVNTLHDVFHLGYKIEKARTF